MQRPQNKNTQQDIRKLDRLTRPPRMEQKVNRAMMSGKKHQQKKGK